MPPNTSPTSFISFCTLKNKLLCSAFPSDAELQHLTASTVPAHQCPQEDIAKVLSFSSNHFSLNLISCFFFLTNSSIGRHAILAPEHVSLASVALPRWPKHKLLGPPVMARVFFIYPVDLLTRPPARQASISARCGGVTFDLSRAVFICLSFYFLAMGLRWSGGSFCCYLLFLISLINWGYSPIHSFPQVSPLTIIVSIA